MGPCSKAEESRRQGKRLYTSIIRDVHSANHTKQTHTQFPVRTKGTNQPEAPLCSRHAWRLASMRLNGGDAATGDRTRLSIIRMRLRRPTVIGSNWSDRDLRARVSNPSPQPHIHISRRARDAFAYTSVLCGRALGRNSRFHYYLYLLRFCARPNVARLSILARADP